MKPTPEEKKAVEQFLGERGFVLDLGLRETVGAKRKCTEHGGGDVDAVIWNDSSGWCANCNPFVILG